MSSNGASVHEGLQALNNTFASARRSRPPTMQFSTGREDSQVPLKLQRQGSKGGLRGMFTRNRAEKALISPVLEEPTRSSTMTTIVDRSSKLAENRMSQHVAPKRASTLLEAAPLTPSRPSSRASRLHLRPTKAAKPAPASKTAPRGSPRSTSSKQPTRTSAAWDPPPLFQSYPQAIKHAQLSASVLSADSIIRSNHKRSNSIRDELNFGNPDLQVPGAASKKPEKPRGRHRRQPSNTVVGGGWTQKIFVLVTSGYLLQYSGEGSFDRLPEKMMQLGKDSVAFASDVIPGKHWVLQISQAIDSDGTPAADSRSLLSRLAFRGADYRRTATSLLLVLDSAEDLDSWLAVVRREIESLGGKKLLSETGKPKPDEKVHQLKAQPGHRYVQRNPDQFSGPNSPMLPSFGPPPWNIVPQQEVSVEEKPEIIETMESPEIDMMREDCSTPRPQTGQESIANSVTSHDGRQLDNLRDSTIQLDSARENPNRFSYMSSGQRTLITSQGSSRASSPSNRESISTFDDYPLKLSTESVRPRPNAFAINERRRSMLAMQNPILETEPKLRPHSTFGVPTRPPRSPPRTPNFSVPTFSSKRFSSSRAPGPSTEIPTIVTTTPSKAVKGPRKSSATLSVLPSVTASPTKRTTPTKSRVQQTRASVIDAPQSPTISSAAKALPSSRSSSLAREARPSERQSRRISSMETPQLERQPRKMSSMQALREALKDLPGAPSIATPASLIVPPAALTTPLPPSPHKDTRPTQPPLTEAQIALQIAFAPAKYTPRRPNSMQTPPNPATCPPKPRATPSPSPSPRIKALRVQTLVNRRSMPTLAKGPPPAPPPDCALPPLPLPPSVRV